MHLTLKTAGSEHLLFADVLLKKCWNIMEIPEALRQLKMG